MYLYLGVRDSYSGWWLYGYVDDQLIDESGPEYYKGVSYNSGFESWGFVHPTGAYSEAEVEAAGWACIDHDGNRALLALHVGALVTLQGAP